MAQVEIGLPEEKGRTQIFNIHTTTMKTNKKLSDDVNIFKLAEITKNFSGAEIEGVVRAAQSCALNRLVKADGTVTVDEDAADNLKVTMDDFLHALEHDIKPALGSSQDQLETFNMRGVIEWSPLVKHILQDGKLAVKQASQGTSGTT